MDIDKIFSKVEKPKNKQTTKATNQIVKKNESENTVPKKPTLKIAKTESNDKKNNEKLKKKISKEKAGNNQNKRAKHTDDGLKIYNEDDLNIGKGGNTPECPFDCNCCF